MNAPPSPCANATAGPHAIPNASAASSGSGARSVAPASSAVANATLVDKEAANTTPGPRASARTPSTKSQTPAARFPAAAQASAIGQYRPGPRPKTQSAGDPAM